jgi:hypothetical protein
MSEPLLDIQPQEAAMPLADAKQAMNELASQWDATSARDRARAEAELAELALHLIRVAGQCGVELAYVTNRRQHGSAAGRTPLAPRYHCASAARHNRH